MMRPLWTYYPEDPEAVNTDSEYFFGKNLLAAPVTERNRDQWSVYLPQGKWYDYWKKIPYTGGKTVTVPAALDTIPLFVPAGGILVKAPVVQYIDPAAKNSFDEISIEVYTGADGSFTLYEDDGITLGYQRGENTITELFWHEVSQSITGRGRSFQFPGAVREIPVVLYPSGEQKRLRVVYKEGEA
jgi:alpha-glucosidase (family GH31 glycosyl hydrolase)